jgi:hypothetical protein
MVGSKENTSRGNSTNSAFFSQVDYFPIAKNNRSTLFDTISVIESNSLAGYFRLNWSNLCTHLQILDCVGVKLVRASRLAS